METKPLDRVIEIVGTQAELARRIAVKPAYVWNWLYRDKAVPPDAVRAVAEAVDWKVTPHELRPDIYPHPLDGLPAHLRAEQPIVQPDQAAA